MKGFVSLLFFALIIPHLGFSSCGVTAGFTPTNTSVCTGEIVNFTNTSTGAISYEWHLDEFTYSTQTNSLLSFGSAGVYSIELIADDGAGCLDSITIDITVSQASNAGSDNSAIFCNTDDSVDLNSYLDGSLTGFWEEISNSGQFNATTGWLDYYDLPEADYFFNYIVPGVGACPNDTAEIAIEINQEPHLSFNFSNVNIDISDSLFVDYDTTDVYSTATYVWTFCDGNLSTDNALFYNQWSTPGDYCVCVQVNNGNGCVETFCDSTIVVFDQSNLFEHQQSQIQAYPNPTSDIVKVTFPSGSTLKNIVLVDAQGQVLEHLENNISFSVNLSTYEKGTYLLIYELNGITEAQQLFRN